jgi:hypothetical protein
VEDAENGTCCGRHTVSESQASEQVLDSLAKLLADRGFVAEPIVDEARRDGCWPDAGAFLAGLTQQGHMTESQAVRVEALFLERQRTDAESVAAAVLPTGLLDEVEVTAARLDWEGKELSCTFQEHLVAAGLLTPHQASAVEPGVRSAPETPHAEAVADAESRLDRVMVILRGTAVRWAELARGRWATASRRGRVIGVVLALAAAAALSLLTAALFVTLSSALSTPPIEPDCSMDGYGRGTCVFTNSGKRTSRSCGTIVATCEGASLGVKLSPTFCSGDVQVGDSVSIDFSVPEFDRITPNRGDWRDSCGFLWLEGAD